MLTWYYWVIPFIYGHGVNIAATVAYFIEEMTGHSVFNLARQGDSSLEEAYKLTEYQQRFKRSYNQKVWK